MRKNSFGPRTILIMVLLMIVGLHTNAQEIDKAHIIAIIEKDANQIDHNKSYKKKIQKDKTIGSVNGYYKNGQLRKMTHNNSLSNGIESFSYYFKNNSLIYVHETFDSFLIDEKTKKMHKNEKEKTFEGFYYFDKGTLIDMKTTGHNRFENDANDPQTILLKESSNYKKLLLNH